MTKNVLKLWGFLLALLCVPMYAQVDVTSKITNADLTDGLNGWTQTNMANKGGSPVAFEAYAGWGNVDVPSYSLTQEVNLPAGEYRLEGYAFFRYGLTFDVQPEASLATMVAGDKSVVIKTLASEKGDGNAANGPGDASAAFAAGKYLNTLEFTVETEGNVTIGYQGTFDLKQSWFICGPMKLYSLSTAKSVYERSVADLRAEVETGVGAAYKKVVEDYITGLSPEETDEGWTAAATEVNKYLADVKQVKSDFARLKATTDEARNLEQKAQAKSEDVSEDFTEAITTAIAAYDVVSKQEELLAAIINLSEAMNSFALNAMPLKGNTLDYGFLVEGVGNSTKGWTRSFSCQNYTYKNSTEKNNGDLTAPGFIECWNGNAYSGTLTYTLNGLPVGKYTVGAYTFVSAGTTDSFIANNEKVGINSETALFTNPVLTGVNVTDGTLTFGMEVNDNTWMGITNITLAYQGLLDAESSATALEAAVEALKATGYANLNQAVNDKVTAVLKAAETVDKEDLLAVDGIVNGILDIIADVKELKESYPDALEVLADVKKAYAQSDERVEGAKATFAAAIAAFEANLTTVEDNEELEDALDAIDEAYDVYLKQAVPTVFGMPLDYTGFIENNSFESGALAPWEGSNGGDTGVKRNDGNYATNGFDGDYLFNTWGAADMFVKQTLADMPKGVYQLRALAASDAGVVVNFTLNGTQKAQATCVEKGTAVEAIGEFFELTEAGSIEIKAASTSWFKVDDFRLYYYGETVIETPLEVASVNPIEGEVSEIGMVAITAKADYALFNGKYVKYSEYYTAMEEYIGELPYLLNKTTGEKIEASADGFYPGDDTNTLTFAFMDSDWNPITAPGEYELVVPAGLFRACATEEDWNNKVLSGAANVEARFSYTIVGSINIEDVNPSEYSEVPEIDQIVVTLDCAAELNTAEDAPQITLGTWMDTYPVKVNKVEGTDNQFAIVPETTLKEEGMYILTIPAKAFVTADGLYNQETVGVRILVVAPAPEPEYNLVPTSVSPADGSSVESLSKVTLTFEGKVVTPDPSWTGKDAYIQKEGSDIEIPAYLGYDWEDVSLIYVQVAAIEEEGTYTLTIPAGMIIESDEATWSKVYSYNPELVYTFKVGGDLVKNVFADGKTADIYTVNGVLVKKAATAADVKTLKNGLYVINGQTVLVRNK